MPEPVIAADNLVKAYKVKGKPDFVAVDGLSFEVAPGESFEAEIPAFSLDSPHVRRSLH